MVERFNGRISAEVLAITLYSHDQLEQLLRGFNAAYNARRQRVLEGQTPDQVVAERLTAKPALANAKRSGRPGPDDIIKARLIAESAKEVSQPYTLTNCTISSAAGRGMTRRCGACWPNRSTDRSAARARCWWSMTQACPRRANSRSGWRGNTAASWARWRTRRSWSR